MTVRDGVIEGPTITFLLSGYISRGSTPLLDLLIRRSRRLGFSVTFVLDQVTGVEREALRQLVIWQAEGVTLSDAPVFIRQHLGAVRGSIDPAPGRPVTEGSRAIVSYFRPGAWN